MQLSQDLSGIDFFYKAILELQDRVITGQKDQFCAVAAQMAATISRDQRIFVFGTGHSHMLVEEGFFRAGGLVAVDAIFSSALMLHENPVLSSQFERTPGFAATLLDRHEPVRGEMIFIYSNSGVNQMPVEMAQTAKARGLCVISVSSLAYARVAPLSPAGVRLDEIADFAIDNGGLPGDALAALPGMDWKIGASSTIINALIWNCLLVETARQLIVMGIEPPVLASFNMPGAADHNQGLLQKWKKINRSL